VGREPTRPHSRSLSQRVRTGPWARSSRTLISLHPWSCTCKFMPRQMAGCNDGVCMCKPKQGQGSRYLSCLRHIRMPMHPWCARTILAVMGHAGSGWRDCLPHSQRPAQHSVALRSHEVKEPPTQAGSAFSGPGCVDVCGVCSCLVSSLRECPRLRRREWPRVAFGQTGRRQDKKSQFTISVCHLG
jgi:hypothetical protein